VLGNPTAADWFSRKDMQYLSLFLESDDMRILERELDNDGGPRE
jgi:hypothetical protein